MENKSREQTQVFKHTLPVFNYGSPDPFPETRIYSTGLVTSFDKNYVIRYNEDIYEIWLLKYGVKYTLTPDKMRAIVSLCGKYFEPNSKEAIYSCCLIQYAYDMLPRHQFRED